MYEFLARLTINAANLIAVAVIGFIIPAIAPPAHAAVMPEFGPHVAPGWQLHPGPEGRPPAVQIEGERGTGWGIRTFAREVAEQVPGLTIHTTGTCAENPWAVCVRVRVVNRPNADWHGLARWTAPDTRVILLNAGTRHTSRYAVAAHEFAHIIGLGHHHTPGVVGSTPDVVHLSAGELQALRDAYPHH